MSTSQHSVNTELAPPAQPYLGEKPTQPKRQQADPDYATIIIYTDGSYQHHRNIAGIGFVLKTLSGNEIYQGSEPSNAETSMEAEAQAIHRALEIACQFDPRHVEVHTDCDPLQRKLTHEKPPAKNLFKKVRQKIDEFTHSKIEDIPRKQNQAADELATIALEREKDRIKAD